MTDHPCSETLCAHVTRGSDLVEIVMLWLLSTWVLVTFRTVALAQEHHIGFGSVRKCTEMGHPVRSFWEIVMQHWS